MQERLTIVRPPDLGRRLAVAVHDACTSPVRLTTEALPLITARLACGDFEGVHDLLHDPPPAPVLPIVVARFVRWTGEVRAAAALWSRVVPAVTALADSGDTALRRATYDELAATATDVGDPQMAAHLLALARREPDARPDAPSDSAVELIRHTAFDLLGLDPDAARGRLRLRPRTDAYDALETRHIRFGDAAISFSAVRDAAGVILRIEQDAGSIPVTVLLEPFVAKAEGAEVDGKPADLVARDIAGGSIVPVQIVLDRERTLRVRTATP
ncbi:MAG TPA: hypothetical protein VFZ24_06580 [Longimicrobiales bacterium]